MRDRPAGCASCASRLCGALCGSRRVNRNGADFPRARASDALRQQTDLLEPAGRRFAHFFLVLHRALPDLQRMKLC